MARNEGHIRSRGVVRRTLSILALVVLAAGSLFVGACASLPGQTPAELRDIYLQMNQIKLDVAELKNDQKESGRKTEYSLQQIDQKLSALSAALDSLKVDIDRMSGGSGVTLSPGVTGTTPSNLTGADEELRLAQEQYAKGNYDRAAEIYLGVLAQYKDAPQAPEASIRLAKVYYQQKKYKEAREGFETFLRDYPASDKIPQVLHSKGLCEIQMKDMTAARQTFERLKTTYPDYEPELVQQIMANYLK
jgi:tetratricopeptide (TPR) repeat protein